MPPGALSPFEDVTLTNHSKLPNGLPMALLKASPLPFKKHCFPTPELPNSKCCTMANTAFSAQPSAIFCFASDVVETMFFILSLYYIKSDFFTFSFLLKRRWGPLGPRGKLDFHPPP